MFHKEKWCIDCKIYDRKFIDVPCWNEQFCSYYCVAFDYYIRYKPQFRFGTLHNFKVAMNNDRLAIERKKYNFVPIQAYEI